MSKHAYVDLLQLFIIVAFFSLKMSDISSLCMLDM
jgi:hypothetical protein